MRLKKLFGLKNLLPNSKIKRKAVLNVENKALFLIKIKKFSNKWTVRNRSHTRNHNAKQSMLVNKKFSICWMFNPMSFTDISVKRKDKRNWQAIFKNSIKSFPKVSLNFDNLYPILFLLCYRYKRTDWRLNG